MQNGEVELVFERAHQRLHELFGATGRAGRAVHDVQHVRSVATTLAQTELERGEGNMQGIVDPLAPVRRTEERIATVEDRRAAPPALALVVVTERAAAAVVHERRVLDEMPHAEPRGAEAEVDLLAVAATEGLLVEETAHVERLARRVHAEPDAGDHLGAQLERVLGDEYRTFVDARCRRVELERFDHRLGQRADRSMIGERRHRGDVGKRGRVREPIEPARGDGRVGVEDHDVGVRAPQPDVDGFHETEVLRVAQHRHRHGRGLGADAVEIRGHRGLRRGVVDDQELERDIDVRGVPDHALEATANVLEPAIDRHDDRDRRTRSHRAVS